MLLVVCCALFQIASIGRQNLSVSLYICMITQNVYIVNRNLNHPADCILSTDTIALTSCPSGSFHFERQLLHRLRIILYFSENIIRKIFALRIDVGYNNIANDRPTQHSAAQICHYRRNCHEIMGVDAINTQIAAACEVKYESDLFQ